MGVYDVALTEPIARVLGQLGAVGAMVVHADDGLDEISTTAETQVSELAGGQVATRKIKPEDFGLPRAAIADLLIDSAEGSAEVIRGVLGGQAGAARDIVVLNAAAALAVAGRTDDIAAGMPHAAESIDSGAAAAALDKLVAVSNS